MIYLTSEELIRIATRVLGTAAPVRDVGLIESAAARPQATVFGEDAYPTSVEKAAALLHSLVMNHPLVDGNKRLGLAGLNVFCAVNGHRLVATNDEAYELVMAIAGGDLCDVSEIAARLGDLIAERGPA